MNLKREGIRLPSIVLELEYPDYERLQEIYEILNAERKENRDNTDYWSLSKSFGVDSIEILAARLLL